MARTDITTLSESRIDLGKFRREGEALTEALVRAETAGLILGKYVDSGADETSEAAIGLDLSEAQGLITIDPSLVFVLAPMTTIRAKFPALRRPRSVAIVHSGGRMTVFGCLCGATHTAESSTRGRSAQHVTEFFAAHKGCAKTLAARVVTGQAKLSTRRDSFGRHSVPVSMPVLSEVRS